MSDKNLQPAKSSGTPDAPWAPRCHCGRKTEHPCWRTATTRLFGKDEELNLCDEHAREIQLADEAEHRLHNLNTTEEWIKHSSETSLFDQQPDLEQVAFMRIEEQRREYARAYTEHRAAQVVAGWEGEPNLTYEQREKLARLMLRVDALMNTRTLLEDLPDEVLGGHERWVMVDAICDAYDAANEEVERYKLELGLDVDREEGELDS
jgi:hypothetical protein